MEGKAEEINLISCIDHPFFSEIIEHKGPMKPDANKYVFRETVC